MKGRVRFKEAILAILLILLWGLAGFGILLMVNFALGLLEPIDYSKPQEALPWLSHDFRKK